jgi:hypothetical protein
MKVKRLQPEMNRLFQKSTWGHWRATLAFSILIIVALVQSVSALQYYDLFYLVGKINKQGMVEDPVDKYGKLLKCVEKNLGQEKTIGFITSLTDVKDQRREKFFQTQYLLAPIIVADSAKHDLVIGYYPDGVPAEILTRYNLKIKQNCENNLVLLERK